MNDDWKSQDPFAGKPAAAGNSGWGQTDDPVPNRPRVLFTGQQSVKAKIAFS